MKDSYRVLWTAACLVGHILRFDQISGYMRDVLHSPPYPLHLCIGSVLYREPSICLSTGILLPHCGYSASCFFVLCGQAELLVPCMWTVIWQRHTFSVTGPMAWNGLAVALRLTPMSDSAPFFCGLNTRRCNSYTLDWGEVPDMGRNSSPYLCGLLHRSWLSWSRIRAGSQP